MDQQTYEATLDAECERLFDGLGLYRTDPSTMKVVREIATEIVELRAWKESATATAMQWDAIADMLASAGHGGVIGDSRVETVTRCVRRCLYGEAVERFYSR